MDNEIKIETGIIISVHTPFVFYKLKTWLSVLIRWFTKSYWQHTACIVLINNEVYVTEANPKIIPVKWDKFVKNKIIKLSEANFEFNKSAMSNILLSRTGDEYDYAGTLLHQAIYQLSGVWLGHTEGFADRKLYCSEYIAWAYNKIQPDLFKNYYKTSPKDLANDNRFIDIYKGPAKDLMYYFNVEKNAWFFYNLKATN